MESPPLEGWAFWIDRGGTFTDVIARDPEGALHVRKLLSEDPGRYEDAPLAAIRAFLGIAPEAPIPAHAVREVKMGTTLATNALLERKGAPVALVVTAGFGGILEIAYQDRPEIFALDIRKPAVLATAVVEARERVLADASVRTPLDAGRLREMLAQVRETGIDAVAIVFLHSYLNPAHEIAAGEIARGLGFSQITLSHRAANEIKVVGRAFTAVADAYLTPVLRGYAGRIRNALGARTPLFFMQSNGGLADAAAFSGKNAILSGPAGGAAACAEVCAAAGFPNAIGFDMGGTSTDVCRIEGAPELVHETVIAGVRVKAPMIHVETVAAGGGSMLHFDGCRMGVGPGSAGANPGPACYRRGGPATITDANLVLGRVQPRYFPACFGPEAKQPLDEDASRARLEALRAAVNEGTGAGYSLEALAAGYVRIANEAMAKPIKALSVEKGRDPREYALCCFGGAGAQHACAIADALGIETILVHPLAGVLSAYGIGQARIETHAVASRLIALDDADMTAMEQAFAELEARNASALAAQGAAPDAIVHHRSMDLRHAGAGETLPVSAAELGPGAIARAFRETFAAVHGFEKPGAEIEIVNLRVRSVERPPGNDASRPSPESFETGRDLTDAHAADQVQIHFDRQSGRGQRETLPFETPVFHRNAMRPGDRLRGPAMVVEAASTIVVDPGWSGVVDEQGNIVLRAEARPRAELDGARDPVMLEVFNNLFMSVAEQMGKTLERVSHSVNIKERRDFSCALFDGEGELIANAPHIPVHLGAMGESVKAVLRAHGAAMRPGDVYAANNPYDGGSHLPDITVVTPVFTASGVRLFFVANRGHHADIGGAAPGSMPAFSTSIEEEGVLIDNLHIVADGVLREAELRAALLQGPHPARNIPERLSDFQAQVAANLHGAALVQELCGKYGEEAVRRYMGHVRDNAAEIMRAAIAALPQGEHVFSDRLECGARIAVCVTISRDAAHVDFTGTDPQTRGNLNAPPAVAISAVLYVFRTLAGKPIPLNSGCLVPLRIALPEGSLVRPRPPAAVAGGNVETSQRVCDVLLGALKLAAASQGTMNNLSFGNADFGYYETICGGAGAGPGFHGASAVHTHMTNTRITDPEIFEQRCPVVLRAFQVRRNSGGAGQWRGGDGVERVIEFLAPVSVTLLSGRRNSPPFGLSGGAPGVPGRNRLLRADGAAEELGGLAAFDAQPGDVLIIETPGGGGFGPASS